MPTTSPEGSGVFGPPPAGVDLSQNQNSHIYGSVITLMVIGSAAVGLRTLARFNSAGVRFALDDGLIVVALLFALATGICCFISIPYGGGMHLWSLDAYEFTMIWKILYAHVMIYATAVTCTKASILFFYRRIFGITYSLYICLFFVIGYWITIITTINVGCQPLSYFWEQYTNPTAKGHCIDIPKFFFGNGIAAMLIDVIILCVPMPIVWKLQMQKSRKTAVVGILLLGGFVCVASIVRIITLDANTKSLDPTWTIQPVFVWSCVEPFIGIVCACLPTFAPFFRRWWTVVRTKGSSGAKGSGGTPTPRGALNTNSKSSHLSWVGMGKGRKKSKGEWGQLGGSDTLFQSQLRPEDEVELTSSIVGGRGRMTGQDSFKTKGSDGDVRMGGIQVREDVEWSSAHLDRKGHGGKRTG